MSRLEEIKARVDAATEGPWEVSGTGQSVLIAGATPVENQYVCESHSLNNGYPGKTTCWRNIEFIAHARADVPYLLGVIESQAKEIEALRVGLKEYCNIRLSGRMTHYWAELQTQYADAIAKARQELK